MPSGPWSLVTDAGAPRGANRHGRTWPTSPAVSARAQALATRARGSSSRPVRPFSRRPAVGSSWTQASLQPWCGSSARGGVVVLTPTGRRWRAFVPTWRPAPCRRRRPVSRLTAPGSAFQRAQLWRYLQRGSRAERAWRRALRTVRFSWPDCRRWVRRGRTSTWQARRALTRGVCSSEVATGRLAARLPTVFLAYRAAAEDPA
jgi:hypothetical protein